LGDDQNSLIAQKAKQGMNFFSQNDNTCPTPLSCHLKVGVCQMAIEIFQLPKRGAHYPPRLPLGQLKNFNHHSMVGVCWKVTEFF